MNYRLRNRRIRNMIEAIATGGFILCGMTGFISLMDHVKRNIFDLPHFLVWWVAAIAFATIVAWIETRG